MGTRSFTCVSIALSGLRSLRLRDNCFERHWGTYRRWTRLSKIGRNTQIRNQFWYAVIGHASDAWASIFLAKYWNQNKPNTWPLLPCKSFRAPHVPAYRSSREKKTHFDLFVRRKNSPRLIARGERKNLGREKKTFWWNQVAVVSAVVV